MSCFVLFRVLWCFLLVQTIFSVFFPSFDSLPDKILLKHNIETEGSLTVQGVDILAEIRALIPPGTIVAYNGNEIPNGWALCDGNDGTPDLQDKFVVSTGSSFTFEETGGSFTSTVSVSKTSDSTALTESQLPSHNHNIGYYWFYAGSGHSATCDRELLYADPDLGTRCSGPGSHATVIENTGGNQGHDHSYSFDETIDVVPPYYALKYIMKLP